MTYFEIKQMQPFIFYKTPQLHNCYSNDAVFPVAVSKDFDWCVLALWSTQNSSTLVKAINSRCKPCTQMPLHLQAVGVTVCICFCLVSVNLLVFSCWFPPNGSLSGAHSSNYSKHKGSPFLLSPTWRWMDQETRSHQYSCPHWDATRPASHHHSASLSYVRQECNL